MKELTVYSTKTCAWCGHVEKYLTMKGVPYKKVMLDDEPELRQELLNKTGAMTVPITTDGVDYVIGWSAPKLNELINKVIRQDTKGI